MAVQESLTKRTESAHDTRMQGSVKRTPEGNATIKIVEAIFRANGRLLRAGDTLAKDLGITSARWQVLGALDDTPKTVAQVAREFEQTRQSVLWVVQSLVRDGMLELVDNPDHRRAKLVRLTSKGREVYVELTERQTSWVNEIGKLLDLGLLNTVENLISELADLAARGDLRPGR